MESTDTQQDDFGTGPFLFDIDNPLKFGEIFHIALQNNIEG
jgi:hypothetical protein